MIRRFHGWIEIPMMAFSDKKILIGKRLKSMNIRDDDLDKITKLTWKLTASDIDTAIDNFLRYIGLFLFFP